MNKIALLILIIIATVSCKPQSGDYNKITIQSKDSVKNIVVEMIHTDTFIFEVPNFVSDSLILASVKATTDSLRNDSLRRDSLYRENFRRMTKKINGGYNGYADREKLWNKAKQVLHEKENRK